jgi:hypothetical protein
VDDGEPFVRIRVKASRLREPVVGQRLHPLPREAVFLAGRAAAASETRSPHTN